MEDYSLRSIGFFLRGSTAMIAIRFLLLASVVCTPVVVHGQVFVVGEKSATDGISTAFRPTRFAIPGGRLSERGRRELIRDLNAEQGFAHMTLPLAGLTITANGPLKETPEEYKRLIYNKGQSCAPGDRVQVTALTFKGDRMIIDLNGGPFAKHRFLSHIQLDGMQMAPTPTESATGSRITLVFPDGIPEISAPEVKALLTPLVDFGAKTSAAAYADSLPEPVKKVIAHHDVVVGMDRKMVLAALGPPDSRVREQTPDDPSQAKYEEWIYGQVPKTVKFVRFTGDRVTLIKIAELGKPIEIRDKEELAAYLPPMPTREVAMGDVTGEEADAKKTPPTLRRPGDPQVADGQNKVQYPVPAKVAPIPADPATASAPLPSASTGPVTGQGAGRVPTGSPGPPDAAQQFSRTI
jgi:hypothetical protein